MCLQQRQQLTPTAVSLLILTPIIHVLTIALLRQEYFKLRVLPIAEIPSLTLTRISWHFTSCPPVFERAHTAI